MSNFCGRHFNRKNAVWSVGFIVLLFFEYYCYNLISGTNPHEEDYRLTVDWHSCGFFYSKTKTRRLYHVRETDNLILRYPVQEHSERDVREGLQ